MSLRPKTAIDEQQLKKGLSFVIKDGLVTEIMISLSGGSFLIAVAILLGATNAQIGILAGMPTLMNVFQLLSIWLVRRYNNRKMISVLCTLLARIPLIVIGCLVLFFPSDTGINALIFFLIFFYFFGSVAGPTWNSWMKDLIPENMLGSFFSHRTMLSQTLNIILSLAAALLIDFIKKYQPNYELTTYSYMFITAGVFGITGAFFLYKTPEPKTVLSNKNIVHLLQQPLKNQNFRRLLIFNSAWVFAINIATPFFTVYMMKTLELPLSYIIALNIVTQLSGIFTVQVWGTLADRYSNKTIIAICAPLYIGCIIAWCFVGLLGKYPNILLIVVINLLTGVATAGINLSLTNIGLKLAPREDAIVYLSAKNIITAFFGSLAPVVGGYLADFFSNRHINISAQYSGPLISKHFHLLSLHEWNFLFVIGALIALFTLQLLGGIKEEGEVHKDIVVRIMRSTIRNNLKDYFIIGTLLHWHEQVSSRLSKTFRGEKEEKMEDRS